jgi:hypothetical protein
VNKLNLDERKNKFKQILNEKDAIAGDNRFSAAKELTDKKAELTDKEKEDNAENVEEIKKEQGIESPSNNEDEKNNENEDEKIQEIEKLRKEEIVRPDEEIIAVPEKHKRIKILSQFNELFVKSETMISALDDILIDNLTESELEIYDEIYDSLIKLNKKLEHYITYGFHESKYERALYIYAHLRSELLLIIKIVRRVLHVRDKDFEEDKKKK